MTNLIVLAKRDAAAAWIATVNASQELAVTGGALCRLPPRPGCVEPVAMNHRGAAYVFFR
jgi:hypothetical protein